MHIGKDKDPAPLEVPSLLWLGTGLIAAGGLVEGAVTGTEHAHRYPYTALAAFTVLFAGAALLLLGYHCQLGKAGLPANPAFFRWAALSLVAFTVGWSSLRGAIPHLDESWRDVLVLAGVAGGLLGMVLATVSFCRWWSRLQPEQQTRHRLMTRPWVNRLVVVALVAWAGAAVVNLLVTGRAG